MAKIYSVLAGGLLSLLALGAQPAVAQVPQAPPRRTCGTEDANTQIQNELKRLIPGYNPNRSTNTGSTSALRTSAVLYTLPIVVHVIHNGEAAGVGSNIAQGQIQSQLTVLNEDYRNTNADGALVPAVYQPRRGDMEVQFANALRDPSGNTLAEPGIDRVNRNTRGWNAGPYTRAYIENTIKPATSWDPDRYINIWVMDLGGGLLGYAQFPDNNANLGGLNTLGGAAATDGVVLLYSAYGSRAKFAAGVYSSPYDRGRTLTHELGHWFGFRHIWGDANCGDDYCADTPTQQKENYGCVAFPQITCSNVTGDMSMNYMDYSNDACMYMFTQSQKDRLQAVMVNTPRRAALAYSNVACPNFVATTVANNGPACVGGSLTLTATGPAGATYAWTGPNGFTSTAQNPTINNVTVAAAGTYKVLVSVTTGACPGQGSTNVVVNPTPPTPTLTSSATGPVCTGSAVTLTGTAPTASGTLPSTDFNSGAPAGWTITNAGAPATTWQYSSGTTISYPGLVTNFSLNGSRFAYAISDAGGQGSTTNTSLISPVFSTVGYSAMSVSFQNIILVDSGSGAVEISTNGGTTWTPIATYTSVNPAATSTINLGAYLNQPTVQLRWKYTDTWGYLWAIDNVAFSGTPASYTYAWTLVSGDGLPATTNTPTITVNPTQNSVYRLSVTYAGGNCPASSTVSVAVVPTPILAASASVVCAGTPSQLSATNIPATGYTYAWTLVSGDGLPATTNTATISVTPTKASVYRLTVSSGTCSTSSTITVTGVTNQIDAYPVPFGDAGLSLQVSTCTAGPASVQIFDIMGRRVYDSVVSTPQVGITTVGIPETGRLRPGKYVVKVQQGSQNTTINVVRQ
ncbi:MAG TPA: M43 family zinc metalloprotease [Hymenobacter sp.]|uniref:M43 family zinc metalloprotease n=1 Tax=Hymenobacter sp. TaxID=1898978 RepID=UPI002D7F32B1|nr:M43 family zinc metalloprotease [Hymenobacter sp.]HET9504686.1 M43 family zinc metalloprotease [Hymenobacter sp.]